jgi:hypothetical protein
MLLDLNSLNGDSKYPLKCWNEFYSMSSLAWLQKLFAECYYDD